MNDQTLSPQIEKALSDLRQAIIDALNQGQPVAPAIGLPVMPPQPAPQANTDMPTLNPVNPMNVPVAAPVPEMTATPMNQPIMQAIPETTAPAMPASEPVAPILPDLSSSPNNVTDLSGLPPVSEPTMAANNGLDESLPIMPPTAAPEAAPAVVMPTPEMMTTPEVAPAPAMSTMPTPAPASTPVSAGLPKANSLLSSVLKKGWNSNQ